MYEVACSWCGNPHTVIILTPEITLGYLHHLGMVSKKLHLCQPCNILEVRFYNVVQGAMFKLAGGR